MKTIQDRICTIKDTWFIMEPAYFVVLCMIEVHETDSITNNICCGSNCIYINPKFFENKSDKVLEEFLKVECTRMLLKHPNGRQLPCKDVAYKASNIILKNIMKVKYVDFGVQLQYGVYNNESFEDIYIKLKNDKWEMKSSNSKGQQNNDGDNADMDSNSLMNSDDAAIKNTSKWGEDELSQSVIDDIIEKIAELGKDVGSLPSSINNDIFARNIKEPDYKSILRKFRASVINSTSTLTRMKPNRRYEYEEMGSRRGYTTKLLICGDMSGSMSEKEVGEYMAFIGGFFKYGIASIDFIQFDVKVYDDSLQKFTKSPKMVTRKHNGGTTIEDIIEYVERRSKTKYDGIIICSDGEFVPNKNLWSRASIRNNYMFCINTKHGYNSLKNYFNNKIKLSYIEYNSDVSNR